MRGPSRRDRILPILLGALAFACGAMAIGWASEHQRAECWRDLAEEGLAAEGECS